jgi:hypothetical protein
MKPQLLSLAVCTIATATLVGQSPTINVYPALAPNVFGSPSFTPWESNVITALQNNQTSGGNPAFPSYYQQIPNGSLVNPWLVSEFPSWLTKANPGTVFGPDFAGEFGNRMYFNLHIVGNGQRYSLNQLSFVATSTDVDNFLGFTVNAGSYNYGSGFVGLNYGGDNAPGGGDDFFITGGANTQLFDELYARGSGNANAALNSSPGATDQDKLNNVLDSMPDAYEFRGVYTLDGTSGNAFVVVSVPEPATVMLTAAGGMGLGLVGWKIRKRRRQRGRKKTV